IQNDATLFQENENKNLVDILRDFQVVVRTAGRAMVQVIPSARTVVVERRSERPSEYDCDVRTVTVTASRLVRVAHLQNRSSALTSLCIPSIRRQPVGCQMT
ncbi:hypothetical protein ANCCAN_28217, partial [Ancylostoma caninum]